MLNTRLGLASITALLLAAFTACQSSPPAEESSAQVLTTLSQAASASDVASVRLTISAPDMSTRTTELVRTGGQWGGVIGQLPAGANRTFRAEALDASGAPLFEGEASGVTLTPSQTTAVSLILQPTDAPPAFGNSVPAITSVVASPSSVAPGGLVTLTATAADPDAGDLLSAAWSSTGGTFSDETSFSTTWTAPQTPGTYTLTLVVLDSLNAATSLSLTLQVQGNGSAAVNVSFNSWPQVTGMEAAPTTVAPGATTTVTPFVSEQDGDEITYDWSASCPGTWEDSASAIGRFTPAEPGAGADPVCTRCTLTLLVSDSRGGLGMGTLSLCVGTQASAQQPPLVTETFQSALSVQSGGTALFRVRAEAGEAGPLTFTWQSSTGTLAAPTSTGSTSQVTWTAPAAAPGEPVIVEARITNAQGASSFARFTVQVQGSVCPAECPAPDACQMPGTCDPLSGQCVYESQPDGTPCGEGSGCVQGTCTPSSLRVEVYDMAGIPLEGASVSVAETAYATDFSGAIELSSLPPGRIVARVEAAGHAPATAVAVISPGDQRSVIVRLLPFGAPLALDSTSGGSVSRDNIRVTLPANAVVDANGEPFSGTIGVTLIPLDPTSSRLAAMPGPLEGVGEEGTSSSLLSVSMAEVSLWGGGQPLQLAPGALATLELPIPDSLQASVTAGQEIPAWWFDLEAGVWREDGAGVIQPSTTQPGRLAWFVQVSHFTWWNADLRWNFSNGASCVRVHVAHDVTRAHVPNVNVAAIGQTALASGGGTLARSRTTRSGSSVDPDPVCVDIVSQGTSRLTADRSGWVVSSYTLRSSPVPAGYTSANGSYLVESRQNHGTCGTGNCLDVEIRMVPKTVIKGRVTPRAPGSAAGIRVSAQYTHAGERFTASAITDGSGNYCLPVPPDVQMPLTLDAHQPSSAGRYFSGSVTVPGPLIAGRTCTSSGTPTTANITVGAACTGPLCAPDWNLLVGDGQMQTVTDVAVDASGNSFLSGYFMGTAIFPPCEPMTATDQDAFLVKLNSNGQCVWSQRLGGTGTQRATAVAVDSLGNALIAGHYENTINFGGGASLGQATLYDGFIAKLTPGGAHLWSVRIGGSGNQQPTDVAVNPSGLFQDDVAITGYFSGTLEGVPSNGQDDGFVLVGNPEGVFYASLGSQLFTFGGMGRERPLSVAFVGGNSGDVVVAGEFDSSFNFDGTGPHTPDGAADGFVARLRNRYRSSTSPSWLYTLGGGPGDTFTQRLSQVAVNTANNDVVVAGSFDGTLSFGSVLPPTGSNSFRSFGDGDAILMRLTAEGVPQAALAFGDPGMQHVSSLAVISGPTPSIFLGGWFTGDIWPGPATRLANRGAEDGFLARYDSGLNLVWARQEGAINAYVTSPRVAVEPVTNRLFLTATTQGPGNPGLDLGLGPLLWAGSTDILVARFLP